jgi:signal transduction histidine kinase/ActR/RegA family two-component response regulator
MVVSIIACVSLFAYLLSVRLQGIISNPILSLTEVAKNVSNNQEYSIRATKLGDDEIGVLIDSFNEMMSKIQDHKVELIEINESLEEKVKERTSDLNNSNRELITEINERKQTQEALLTSEQQLTATNQQLQANEQQLTATNHQLHANEQQLRASNQQLQAEVTERKLAEEALISAKETAEAANKAKSQFLANMSHEIRTPMNAIVGFSDLLVEEVADEQKQYVGMIRTGCNNLLQIIGDILDFSKIEAGKLEIEMAICPLEEVLSQTKSLVELKALEKDIDFKIKINEDVPKQILTDAGRLSQCLINLANNSVKFTETGHVHINVSLKNDADDKPCIRFDVADTGIGIKQEEHELIFESFSQADYSSTRKHGGTGLGLAITKQLITLLGGEVSMTSQEGKGSVFSLVVPVDVDITDQPLSVGSTVTAQTDKTAEKSEQSEFSGHILIAEDSFPNQTLIRILLEKIGLEVIISKDGSEALEKALAKEFDLILMDMMMPNMNGYEATEALRKEGIATPVIALTANAMEGDEKKCIDAGCDDYLAKPIDRDKLIEMIQKYIPAKVHA